MHALQSLAQAWQLYEQGQLDEAAALARPLLESADPTPVHELLGAIALAQNQPIIAVEHFQQALAGSDRAERHYYLGLAYQSAQQWQPAVEAYEKALRLDPSSADTQTNLATCLYVQGESQRSLAAFRAAAALQPDSCGVHLNLGNWYRNQKDFGLAEQTFRRVVELSPELAVGHCQLGFALLSQSKYDAAIASYQQALRIDPGYVEALHDLASAYQLSRRLDEAMACFRRVLEMAPAITTARLNLATILQRCGKMDEARVEFQRWLAETPDDARRYCEIGKSAQFERRLPAAIQAYEQSLRLDPNLHEAEYLLALSKLTTGDLAGGWPDFESRLEIQSPVTRGALPRWQGEPIAEQSILVYADGGLGDTLQFIRFLQQLTARANKVVCAVQGTLTPLLLQSGFRGLTRLEELYLPACDWQVALMSLPGLLGTTLETIPSSVPYLKAAPALVDRWRGELQGWPGLKVGIHWHGARQLWSDQRSMPLAEFEPLSRLDGVTLFSLQRAEGSEELAALGGRFPVVDLGSRLDRTGGAFMDTAAVMKNLDLVITCDTSIAHLAGGLGVPVWVALRRSADWRWFLDRDDSPWYSSMKLFRQSQWNEWTDVFRRMAAELASWPIASTKGSG